MDLSTYYKDFQSTYNLAVVTLFFAVFTVVFIGIRSIKDEKDTVKTKITVCLLLVFLFACILNLFLRGPYLAKMDIEQKTIFYYEGSIEITEVSNGLRTEAVFLIDGNEMHLKYSDKDDYNSEQIKVGKYEGKIIYAQHVAQVLYLDIQETQLDK